MAFARRFMQGVRPAPVTTLSSFIALVILAQVSEAAVLKLDSFKNHCRVIYMLSFSDTLSTQYRLPRLIKESADIFWEFICLNVAPLW